MKELFNVITKDVNDCLLNIDFSVEEKGDEIAKTVAAIKRAADDYDRMKHLQYEFIENHEKLDNGVVRVTYSDGSVITVDYLGGEYSFASPEENNA